jgi:(Z)-2-((N-methylformamido)methylene)-5-hydroxybutyrolactone dehydrogenase
MRRYLLYIDGREIAPETCTWFDSYNPFTAEPWAQIPQSGAADVDAAVQAAHRSFAGGPWSQLTATERGQLLCRLAQLLAREANRLAEIEVRDNGKLLAEMRGQVRYLPYWFSYFGGLADKIEGRVPPLDKKGYFNFTRREPLGVVAAITPWNSPLLLAGWKIAPALAAGCTVVIKPSEYASASTLEFAQLFAEAGFPSGVVNVVTGSGHDTGAALVRHPLVKKISFTGSDGSGRAINEVAAKQLKHVSLELGGKSPQIVFDDADLGDAINGAVSGIFAATGQTCIAGSRLLLQSSIYEEVVGRLVAMARSARMGDPMSLDTQVGPIATQPQHEKVLRCIQTAREQGAQLLLGGARAQRPECGRGWFIEPTVFGEVVADMRIAQEEVFGPVLSVLRFNSEDEAVHIANEVRYGLGAGVWTKDITRAFRVSEQLQAGTVWVNTYRVVSFMSPFGGYKDSGLGRENGIEAINEYLQTKSVWINTGAPTANPFVLR